MTGDYYAILERRSRRLFKAGAPEPHLATHRETPNPPIPPEGRYLPSHKTGQMGLPKHQYDKSEANDGENLTP